MSNMPVISEQKFTPEQLKLIKDTIAKNATDDELKLFLYRAEKLGLDPLKPGQIYFIKYGASPGQVVIGIEGFRSIAARTGKLSGIQRGVTLDEKGKLLSAWCEVRRSDWTYPAREEVPFSEFTTGKNLWATKPQTMIKKVAEASALRMAFPDDLGGVYELSELDKEPKDSYTITPGELDPGNGVTVDTSESYVTDEDYRIPFGKWNKRSLAEAYRVFGKEELESYSKWLLEKAEKSAKENGTAIDPKITDLVFRLNRTVLKYKNPEKPNDGFTGVQITDGPSGFPVKGEHYDSF